MSTINYVPADFTSSAIDRLLAQFDGEGLVDPASARSFCEAFDAWISERSEQATHPEPELDRFRAGIWFLRGVLAYASGDVDASLDFFRRSNELSARVGNIKRQILGLRAISRVYEYAGMQSESTRCIFEALDLAEQQGDDHLVGLVLHGLNALYEAQGAYEQLFESAVRTKDIAARTNDVDLLVRAYGVLSLSCQYLDRAEEGLDWTNKALALCAEHGMLQSEIYLKLNMISLYRKIGRIEEAVALANDQLDTIAALPAQHAATIYVDVAEVNVAAGNLSTAAAMLAAADRIADNDRMKGHLAQYYIVAADLYEAQGDVVRALEMMRRHAEHDRETRGREAQARLVAIERHFAAELASKTEELHHLRTVELVEKNQQLSDLIQQKDEILDVVVNDLRNPLTAAQLLGESLLIDRAVHLDDAAIDRLRSIGEATTEMRDTVDTLLASQRNEAISTPAPVAQIVQLAVGDAREISARRDVTINVTIGAADLIANSALLRRSLDDLLWNAVESAEPGAAVDVCVSQTESGARITIAGHDLRFDERSSKGRSLYIARRLIERMQGSIVLSSPSSGDERNTATIDLRR